MKYIVLLTLFLLSFSNVFSDNSTDINANIIKYKMNSAKYQLKPFVENMSQSQSYKLFGNYPPYFIFLGNGEKVKASDLIKKMGYHKLYNDIKMGEKFRSLSITLAASIGGTSAFAIIGSSFMLAFRNQQYNFTDFESYKDNFFISGVICLGISAVSLIEIIILSVFLYKASLHHLNELQVKSIINQYNKYLQKKLKIPSDINLSINFDKSLKFAISYKF